VATVSVLFPYTTLFRSIERLGKDVLAILDALKVERVNYCGLSMGGMTGMWLARFAPERFAKMIFANTAPKSQSPERWNARIGIVDRKSTRLNSSHVKIS